MKLDALEGRGELPHEVVDNFCLTKSCAVKFEAVLRVEKLHFFTSYAHRSLQCRQSLTGHHPHSPDSLAGKVLVL